MNRVKPYLKHLIASFLFLLILIDILFLSSNLIKNILINPYQYFAVNNLSITEIQFLIVFLCLVAIAVLMSFIFYLLLTFRTRFELQIWNATKSVALSREQFRKLYDNAPVPYIMLGENAKIHEPNKAALRFFGVVLEEIEDKNLFSYISGDYKDQAGIFFEYYKTGVAIDRKEVDMITKAGAIKSVLLSVFKMKNLESSSKDAGLAMIFDITEQKLLDKAKTEFLSLASHQLRSPLATTKWYTEMLTSGDLGELNPKQKEYISKLNAVNKDMIELAEVLLNVSRIEMGTLPIDSKPTNVEELTEGILVELSSQIEKKKIKINKQYNNFLQNINSDPKLLRIVIQNIVSNAVKYTLDGGTVSIVFEESSGEKKIIVSDTGIGIPKAEQDRIFSKLFRADNARNLTSSQGTGLGLYLVKSIIESMGGHISFVSEENKGSVFTLTL
jgi:PAS domain S-box-containing protein